MTPKRCVPATAAQALGVVGPCVAHVRLARANTHTKQARVTRALRRGVDPHVCGRRPAWVIDGKPYCLNHAGQRAINIISCQELFL